MKLFFFAIYLLVSSAALNGAMRSKTMPFYARDIEKFKLSLNLPIVDQVVELSIPDDQIAMRLRSDDHSITEPLQIMLPRDHKKFSNTIKELCIKRCQELSQKLQQKMLQDKSAEKVVSISLTSDLFSSLDKKKYLSLLRKKHHRLTLKTEDLDARQKSQLLDQAKLFLDSKELAKLKTNLAKNFELNVDNYLLPRFARNVVSHFTKYKGPNCFQAALAFQNINFAKSTTVNVREELGYHPAMINYDELWRALQANFYELNPEKVALRYGDMIVIMDVSNDQLLKPVDYKTIRHAATYLFNGYVFSKGSKSASSPYLIKPMTDEFKLWQSFTPQIALKVFRNNSTKETQEAKFLDDWLDQT